QDMADQPGVGLGDQFHKGVASVAQDVDQIGLRGGLERRPIDRVDVPPAVRSGRPDHHAPIFSASLWLIGSPAAAWSFSARKRAASSAAMQPMPAAVTAWR